jgi:hypothetical protein
MQHDPKRVNDSTEVIDAQCRVIRTVTSPYENIFKLTSVMGMAILICAAAFDLISGNKAMFGLLLVALAMVVARHWHNFGKRPVFTWLSLTGISVMVLALMINSPVLSLFATAAAGGVWLILQKSNH